MTTETPADLKLTAHLTQYSSIVGGGLQLRHKDGRAAFIVTFIGTTEGITKAENDALATQFKAWADQHGLSVPKRDEPAA